MDGMEEKLSAMLSDPEAMARFRQLAAALSGGMGSGMGGGECCDASTDAATAAAPPQMPPIDSGLAELMGKVLRAYGSTSDAMRLVMSLKPWLQPQRAERLEKAMRIAHLASAAKEVLPELLPGRG